MKQLIRNATHNSSKSHDCLLAEMKSQKIKITYEAYNASEKCTTEFFDGNRWNPIFSLWDMGVEPNNSAYNIWDAQKRKSRADELFKQAEAMCRMLL